MGYKINKNDDWNQWWNTPLSKYVNSRSLTKTAIRKLLKKFIPERNPVFLDVGCGTGYYSEAMLEAGCKVYSLDYSEKALEDCSIRCQGRSTTLKWDILSDAECSLGDVNIIFSDGLLEHFSQENQVKILGFMKKVSVNGGVVINVVPHRYHPYTLVRKLFMKNIYEESMTKRQLMKLHEQAFGNVEIIGQTFSPVFFDSKLMASVFPMHLIAISKVK